MSLRLDNLNSGRVYVKKFFLVCLVAVVSCLMLVACADPKARSEEAIKTATDALAPVKAEASKYIPEQVKALEDKLAAAKSAVDKGDFPAASLNATEVFNKVKDLPAAAAAKKDELTKKWAEVSAALTKTVEEMNAKVAEMAKIKPKKLPAGLDAEKVEKAKTGAEEVTKLWAEADAAAKEGKLADAVAKSIVVKEKTAAVMAIFAPPAPAAEAAATPAPAPAPAAKK
jgi:hypothetical protein